MRWLKKRSRLDFRPYGEVLEKRQLFAGDSCASLFDPPAWIDTVGWQNPRAALDVNHDLFVSALDALIVINDINLFGSHAVATRVSIEELPEHEFLDVNGDELTSPIDVLLVINAINNTSSGNIPVELLPDVTCDLPLPVLEPRTIRANTGFQVDLPSLDELGQPINYSVMVEGLGSNVRSELAALELNYNRRANNVFDLNEKAFVSLADGTNFFITPDGILHSVTMNGGIVIGYEDFMVLTENYYADPTLLTPDKLLAVDVQIVDGIASIAVGDEELGEVSVTFSATSVHRVGLTTQVLTVYKNFPPVVQPVADLRMLSGGSQPVVIAASDVDSSSLEITASYFPQAAYELKNAWGLQPSGQLTQFNSLGENEKWFAREDLNLGDVYFFILPTGEVHRAMSPFFGDSVETASVGLVAELDASYYEDLSLILDALPPPVSVRVSGNRVTVSSIEGYSGGVDVSVVANDGQSRTRQMFHVQTDAPVSLDASIQVSPLDGTVYQLQGATLLRNGVVFLRNVSHFEMFANGDVLTNGRGAADPQPSPGSTFTLRHFRGNTLLKYDGIADFHVDSSGNIFIWGDTFEVIQDGQRIPIVNNVSQVKADGDTLLVLSQNGSLERITATARDVLSQNVRSFGIASGVVSSTKSDGTIQQTVLYGDIEDLVNVALASDPRLQSNIPDGPPARGIVGRYASGLEAMVASVGVVESNGHSGSGTILALGGNQYVLTAAHVVETERNGNTPGNPIDAGNVSFLPNFKITSAPRVVAIDRIFGRGFFGGRDIALLQLHEPVRDVIGAELPDGLSKTGDRILAAGYGVNNTGTSGELHYGYATLDDVVGSRSGRTGPLLVNKYFQNEAAFDHGDSGGPDFVAGMTQSQGSSFWTPIIVGVHSFFEDEGVPNDKVDLNENTYSVQLIDEVVRKLKTLILPAVKVADLKIQVFNDGDGFLSGSGEWYMEVNINNNPYFIRKDFDDSPSGPSYDVVTAFSVETVRQLSIRFKGKEIDGFFSSDDIIPTVENSIEVPPIFTGLSKLVGTGDGDVKYSLWVQFRYAGAGEVNKR